MKIHSKRFLPEAGMSAPTSEGAYRLTSGGKGRGEQCLCLSSSLSHLSKNRCHRLIATVPNKAVFYDRGTAHPLPKLLCPLPFTSQRYLDPTIERRNFERERRFHPVTSAIINTSIPSSHSKLIHASTQPSSRTPCHTAPTLPLFVLLPLCPARTALPILRVFESC
jgi:hypothetical protein